MEERVVARLDSLQDRPEGGPVREALSLLQDLDLTFAETDRAASALVEILKQDPNAGKKARAGFEFTAERVDASSEDTSSTSLLNALDSQDADAELIRRFAHPGRLGKEAKILLSSAESQGAQAPTVDLGLSVFGGWSPDESALGAFFESRPEPTLAAQRVARVLDGVVHSESRENRNAYFRAAYEWMGENTPDAQGHTNLRIAATAEENGWAESPLQLGLESVATEQHWLGLMGNLLPQDGAPKALRMVRNGLTIEARKRGVKGQEARELEQWARALDVLADMSDALPEKEVNPFLTQALKAAEKQSTPDLNHILSSTSDLWFPDLGYRTDQSHVPEVLMAVKNSESVSKDISRIASTAARSVETMGGSQARAKLLEELNSSDETGLKDRPLRRSHRQEFIGDAGMAVITGILGGCAALGLGLVLGPVAGLALFGATTAGSMAGTTVELGRKQRARSSHPGSTLYAVPRNTVDTHRSDILFT